MSLPQKTGNRANNQASSSQAVYTSHASNSGDISEDRNVKALNRRMFSVLKRSALVEYCEKFDIRITSETNLVDAVLTHFENHLEVPEESVLMTDLIAQFLNQSPGENQHLARRSLHEISTQYRNLSQQIKHLPNPNSSSFGRPSKN